MKESGIMKKYFVLFIICFIALIFVFGCAAGPNPSVEKENQEGDVAGFWLGLWHGIISPITFIVSLLSKNVHFYEVHNNGGWYNLGFVLGAGILFGSSR